MKINIRFVIRMLALFAVQSFLLLLLSEFFNGIFIDNFFSAYIFLFVIAAINAVIWPYIVKFTLPILVYTFGLANLLFNGIIIYGASELVEGFYIKDFWSALLIAVFLILINFLLTSIFTINDDSTYYRNVLKRLSKQKKYTSPTDKPGIIFIEIDGLAKPILDQAIQQGYMPNLRNWLLGSHNLTEWETDLTCQTGGCQLGILHGNNKNVPAFRWWDRKRQRIYLSGYPKDTEVIESEHSDGNGLLSKNGSSRGNLFSGDAENVMLTNSRAMDLGKIYNHSFYAFFSSPYNYLRLVVMVVAEIFHELVSRNRQKRKNIKPRLGKERGGVYPLARSFMTVMLKDLTTYTLMGDIYRGESDAIYATYVGYDELAHHSGVTDIDALEHLRQIDKDIGRLKAASDDSNRHYKFVILSDHGQSKGETFKQRYNYTLEDLIKINLQEGTEIKGLLENEEGLLQLNSTINELLKSKNGKKFSKLLNNITNKINNKSHTSEKDLEVNLNQVLVMASGNLGLVYFSDSKQRMNLESINKKYPDLIDNIVKHPGIGFVMIRSKKHGPIVISEKGQIILKTGKIRGENPLQHFRKNAIKHLIREDSYSNCPDILINSFYDQTLDEVAAFEELIGSHGGMGGLQSRPFILYPKEFQISKNKIVGAEKLHKVLKDWTNIN